MPRSIVHGTEIYYEDKGTGSPILFGHGYAGSRESWDGVTERLANRFRCIALDFRGAGKSAHAASGYSIEQFASDVVGLANHLGIERFSYAGLSMGGAVGMQLGIAHASRLETLMLVAPAPANGVPATGGPSLVDAVKTGSRADLARMIQGGFAREVDPELLDRRV